MSTISLCMIVKNEENNIKNALQSILPLIDEIIIVDTGSTDDTKKICSEFPVKLYDFTWNNDFSEARNFSISKASSGWILWLDADEITNINEAIETIKTYLDNTQDNEFLIPIHSFINEEMSQNKQYYISYHNRLFRKSDEFFFRGSIHEQLISDKAANPETKNVFPFITIRHFGHKKEYIVQKSIRNLDLLLKEKQINPENGWLDYHIAAELYRLNDPKKAYLFVNNSIALFLSQQKLPPALFYKLKYDILLHFGEFQQVLDGIEKAISLYPDYVELYFYKGTLLFHMDRSEEAIKSFSQCIVMGESNPKYLILSGNGSFNAYYYIGQCYQKLNKPEEAAESYLGALRVNPDFQPAIKQLDELSVEEKNNKKEK